MIKTIKLAVVLFISSLTLTMYGQETDSFSFLGNSFDKHWVKGSFKLNTTAFVGSNVVNSRMYSDYLFRSSLSTEGKEEFLAKSAKRTNVLNYNSALFEYKVSDTLGVFGKYTNINVLNADKDFAELAFFGNARFEDKTVKSTNSRQLSAENIVVGISAKLNSPTQWDNKLSVGLSFLTNYRDISLSDASIYTAPSGQYIDIDVSNLSILQKKRGVQGVGLSVDFKSELTTKNEGEITFELENLNLTRLLKQEKIVLDTTLRFEGLEYNLFDDSVSFQSKLDSSYNQIVEDGKKDSPWTILPSAITIGYSTLLSPRDKVSIKISTLSMGRFGYSTRLGYLHKFSPRVALSSVVGYGNFTGIIWSEACEIRANNYSTFVRLVGIQSLFIPTKSTNYGLSFGVSKQF